MSRYDGLIIPRSYSEYINKTDAATLSQALQLSGVLDNAPTEDSVKAVKSGGVFDAIDGLQNEINTKQDILTFDDVPTDGSDNPVKSNGIYDALAGKQDTLTFDDTPTASSNNPVKSGGVYSALSKTVIAGTPIQITLDMSSTGMKTKAFSVAPSTLEGKSLIGYVGWTSTYRVAILSVGNDTAYYYVSATYASSLTGTLTPLYA